MKHPVKALLVSTLLALAGFGCGGSTTGDTAEATGSLTSGGEVSADATRVTVGFADETLGEVDDDPPHTRVVLTLLENSGRTSAVTLGEFIGNCSETELVAPDLATHQCWWAGQGQRFHVRTAAGAIVVVKEEMDESFAPDATQGEEIRRITVPSGAIVGVVTAAP